MRDLKIFGVSEEKGKIFTKNMIPGSRVYDEDLVQRGPIEYREWNPRRSKIGAYICQEVNDIFIRKGSSVLYLGVANGTTASHLSDIIGKEGMLFGLDFAFRPMMDFVFLSEERENLAPIFADAAQVDDYVDKLPKEVDVIVQDVAQRNQAEIFIKNVKKYLKSGGFGLLSVKAKSIDIKKRPKQVFREVREQIEKEFNIIDFRTLEPFEKDHVMIVIKKK